MKTKSSFFILALFVMIVYSFSACHTDESKNESAEQKLNLPTVLVCQPQIKNFPNSISLAGNAMPNQEVKVYAMAKGYVKMWRYDIGDMVKRGDILAEAGQSGITGRTGKSKSRIGWRNIYI